MIVKWRPCRLSFAYCKSSWMSMLAATTDMLLFSGHWCVCLNTASLTSRSEESCLRYLYCSLWEILRSFMWIQPMTCKGDEDFTLTESPRICRVRLRIYVAELESDVTYLCISKRHAKQNPYTNYTFLWLTILRQVHYLSIASIRKTLQVIFSCDD